MVILSREEVKEFQNKIGLKFENPELLSIAFSHKSYFYENYDSESIEINDRLRQFGSYLYQLIIADLNFHNIGQDPGLLSQININLKNYGFRETLINSFDLLKYIKCGKGLQKETVGVDSILYPVLAVVYFDYGYEKLIEIISPIYLKEVTKLLNNPISDWKTALQEWVQNKKGTVKYEIIGESGEDHQKTFMCEVIAISKKAIGSGASKKRAQTDAAHNYFNLYISRNEWKSAYPKQIEKYKRPIIQVPYWRLKQIEPMVLFFEANPTLIHQALIHKSYNIENPKPPILNNSSLAYLGSYVQAFIYAEFLYHCLSTLNGEFSLTITQSIGYLGSDKFNMNLTEKINIKELILLSKSERNNFPDSVKVGCIQALFGVMFLCRNEGKQIIPSKAITNLLQNYISQKLKDLQLDEHDSKLSLVQLIQEIGLEWTVKFEKGLVTGPVNKPEFTGFAHVKSSLHKYCWIGKGRTVKEATNNAAKIALSELNNVLKLNRISIGKEQIEFKPFILSYIDSISKSRSPNKVSGYIMRLGGLGIEPLLNDKFRTSYSDFNNTYNVMEQLGIDFNKYISTILPKFYPVLKQKYSDLNDLAKFLDELVGWLKTVGPDTNAEEINPFFSQLVDSLQVFRYITEEEFKNVSLKDALCDVLLLKPKRLNVNLNNLDDSYVFGQNAFLSWFIYNILTKIQDCIIANNIQLDVMISIINSKNHVGVVELILNLEEEKINWHELENKIYGFTHFASFCFAELEMQPGLIKLVFFNPHVIHGNIKQNHIISEIYKIYHTKQVETVYEMSSLGGIIHDLKNNLMMLKKTLLPKRGVFNLDLLLIKEKCLTIAQGLQTYFAFSKPKVESFNLFEFVYTLSREIRSLASPQIEINFSSNILTDEIISDRNMLNSIIINLSKNAIESIDESGIVNVKISMDFYDELMLTVEDNGCGISQDKLSKLFTSFFTTKTKMNGTGLGLPTVKRMIDLLGGIIQVESTFGKGTEFRILIPIEIANN